MTEEIYIKIVKNGPYIVYGPIEINQKTIIADETGTPDKYFDGKVFEVKSYPISLCRCGKSKNAPFCDNAHLEGFDGTETASFEPILQNANIYEGPNIKLFDNEKFCSYARFCDAKGTIWNLVVEGREDTDADAIREANLCPSGRLMIFDKNGNMIEDELPKSISVLEDGILKLSGPLWIRGGIRIENSNGESYEIRNRQTICRCGQSENKPFCDCTHAHTDFKADYGK